MRRSLSIFAAASCLLLLGVTTATRATAQNSGPALSIGIAGPMNGPLADAGKAMTAGSALAAQDLKDRAGLPVTFTIENDEASIAGAQRAATALAAKKLRFVIGHYTSAPTLAASEIYLRNSILLIAPSATSPKLTEGKSGLNFRLAPREEAQGAFAGAYLAREFQAHRILIIQDGSAQSRILAIAAKAALQGAGHKTTAEGDLTADSAGAEAIFLSASAANAALFLKALRASGSSALVLGSDALATPEFSAAAGEAVENLHMTVLADITRRPEARQAVEKLRREGVRDISLALMSHAAVQLLADAATAAHSHDAGAIAALLRSGRTFETIAGPVSFHPSGERRENLYAIAVWQKAADGKYVFALP